MLRGAYTAYADAGFPEVAADEVSEFQYGALVGTTATILMAKSSIRQPWDKAASPARRWIKAAMFTASRAEGRYTCSWSTRPRSPHRQRRHRRGLVSRARSPGRRAEGPLPSTAAPIGGGW